MRGRRRIVEGCEDAGRPALLDKFAHDLIVEELDRRPLDLLSGVLLLFGLESELYEDLLQFLVDVVNAQLLEGVVPEDLEAEDVLHLS